MNCEEFEIVGLESGAEDAVLQHADGCARCAALLERWQSAQSELRALALETRGAQAPARVEMRLRQEFRAARRTQVSRKTVVAAAWALAAAAGIAAAVSWETWKPAPDGDVSRTVVQPKETASTQKPVETLAPANPPLTETPATTLRVKRSTTKRASAAPKNIQAASRPSEPFSLLPGILPEDAQQGDLVKVRMRRAALGALGLPVNEERAGDWIQVDMLVGFDGQPRAVRLDRSATKGATEW